MHHKLPHFSVSIRFCFLTKATSCPVSFCKGTSGRIATLRFFWAYNGGSRKSRCPRACGNSQADCVLTVCLQPPYVVWICEFGVAWPMPDDRRVSSFCIYCLYPVECAYTFMVTLFQSFGCTVLEALYASFCCLKSVSFVHFLAYKTLVSLNIYSAALVSLYSNWFHSYISLSMTMRLRGHVNRH